MKKGYSDALLVLLIWSGFVLVSRIGGISDLLPYDVVALRFGTAAVLLLPFWWFRNRLSLFAPRILALGLVGGIGYCMFVYYGFKHAPVAHAGILLPGLLPVEAAFFSWLVLKEIPSKRRLLGISIIMLGVASLAIENLNINSSTLKGDLAFITAGSMWALYSVLVRKWGIGVWDATLGCALTSAALYMPVYLLFLPKQIDVAPWDAIVLQGFYQGVMAMVVAMIFYMRAMKTMGPARLGAFMALVPVVSGIAAIPFLGEHLTLLIFAGLLFTSIGAWLGSRG